VEQFCIIIMKDEDKHQHSPQPLSKHQLNEKRHKQTYLIFSVVRDGVALNLRHGFFLPQPKLTINR
jgi:hypothetical protein